MTAALLIALPSKGRLKDAAADLFARAGMALSSKGHERRYRGALSGLDGVEVVYTSAAEIVHQLGTGRVHLGLTGEDLVRDTLSDVEASVAVAGPVEGHVPVDDPCQLAVLVKDVGGVEIEVDDVAGAGLVGGCPGADADDAFEDR